MGRRKSDDGLEILGIMISFIICFPIGIIYLIVSSLSKAQTHNRKPVYRRYYPSRIQYDFECMDGTEFECYIADLLQYHGFQNVMLTKSSGDYGVDIVAMQRGQKWVFQCKNYQSRLGIKPIQEVFTGAQMYNAHVAVVITNSYFTENALRLAKKTHVQLWDGKKLTELINDREKGLMRTR